jgi:predicted Zn-dependent protease
MTTAPPGPTWAPRAPVARLLPALALLTALAGGCAPPGPPGGGDGEGPGHRAQRLGLTPEQEYELGVKAYKEILAKSRVVPSGPEVRQVERVGRRIAKAAENTDLQHEINLHLEGYRFDWEFRVLRDPQVNAFCLPGGKIGVYTGLLKLVGDNDDMLAAVLGHEVAHALAHHANERITREAMRQHAIEAAGGGVGNMDPGHRRLLLGILTGASQFETLRHDRQQESEADHIGVFLMAFAGYDPDAAVAFWERMEEASQGRGHPPEILSTHPSDARRIAQLRQWVRQAKAALAAYKAGRIQRPAR